MKENVSESKKRIQATDKSLRIGASEPDQDPGCREL